MRFRTGLLIGLGVGYYFGTKAGRERYDQIHDALQGLLDSEIVLNLRDRATTTIDQLRGFDPDIEVDLAVFEEPLEP